MSLYIGKDLSDTSCFLAASAVISENSFKSSIPSISNNFFIDTRRDLLFCETYDSLQFGLIRTYTKSGLFYRVYRIIVNNIITSAYTKRFLLFINSYNTRVNFVLPSAKSNSIGGGNAYYYGTTYIDVHTLDIATSFKLIVFHHSTEGLNLFNKYDNSNSVHIDSTTFKVNGVDYFKEKFIVSPAINTSDPTFSFGGITFQIINGTDSSGYTFSLSANNNNIKVLSGTKTIFDNTASYLQAFLVPASNTVIDFTMPSGYSETTIRIGTVPTSSKLLAITYYPRISVYPRMRAHGIVSNSTTSEESIFLDAFPVESDGGYVSHGFIVVSFYIYNNEIYVHRLAEYDGDPIGIYPAIDMRLEYFILAS